MWDDRRILRLGNHVSALNAFDIGSATWWRRPAKGTVEILVIDQVERPSKN
jgi:hypothetical protein